MRKRHLFLILFPVVIIVLIISTIYSLGNRNSPNSVYTEKSQKKIEAGTPRELVMALEPVQEQQVEEVTEADENHPATSKLAEFAGFGHTIDRDEEQFSKEEIARQELIATCMKSSGFQYTPAPSTVIDEATINDPEEFERSLAEASSHPNDIYVSSLSADTRKSYYLTLTGMEDPNDPEGQTHNLAIYSDSCVNKAFKKIPSVYAKRNLLSEPFDAMEARIKEDERIILATENWSDCMSDEGYTFSKPSDIHRQMDEAMATAFEENTDSSKAKLTDSKLNKMMKTSERCNQSSRLAKVRQQVRIEFENQFVKDYKTQLIE